MGMRNFVQHKTALLLALVEGLGSFGSASPLGGLGGVCETWDDKQKKLPMEQCHRHFWSIIK